MDVSKKIKYFQDQIIVSSRGTLVIDTLNKKDLGDILLYFYRKIPQHKKIEIEKYLDFNLYPTGDRIHVLSLLGINTSKIKFPGRKIKGLIELFPILNDEIFFEHLFFTGNGSFLIEIEYLLIPEKKPQLWYLG